jgi:hypothetical protein
MIGKIGGYAAPGVYAVTFAVSAIFAMRIFRNKDNDKLDRILLDALLVTTAVMFLYPPLPQYVLLLLPFILFAMTSERRYRIPCALLMIGTTIASISGGPMDLVSVAAYTDLIDMGSVLRAIEICTTPFLGFESIALIGYVGYGIQYAAIISLLWIRFEEAIRKRIAKKPDIPEDRL